MKYTLLTSLLLLCLSAKNVYAISSPKNPWWEVQSIDTMKYSRDLSRETLSSTKYDQIIKDQVKAIAETGATHVAIGTPYDSEFIPVMEKWVDAARENNLSVWFRGNMSGWEEWFDYPAITREVHATQIEKFILENENLFEDGDIFTSCPECENGGPGDPRQNGDKDGHREFLIEEYNISKNSFEKINKKVKANYFSMNADVAKLIMNQKTTTTLDGIIVIDHYVPSPDGLAADVKDFSEQTGAKVVLGEMGAPIPDLHGRLTQSEQAQWLETAFDALSKDKNLIGINYWTNVGGTTGLWSSDTEPREAVDIIKRYYTPRVFTGTVKDQLDNPISNITVSVGNKNITTDKSGVFSIPYLPHYEFATFTGDKYKDSKILLAEKENVEVTLERERNSLFFRLRILIKKLIALN